MKNLDCEIVVALEAIKKARGVLLSRKMKPSSKFKLSVAKKKEHVTEFDLKINSLISEHIATAYPHDSIIGEEGSYILNKMSERIWFIDPIDGTRSFIDNISGYSVIISLIVNHIPKLGVIHDFISNETLFAEKGLGISLLKKGRKAIAEKVDRYESNIIWNPFKSEQLMNKLMSCLKLDGTLGLESIGSRTIAMVKGYGKVFVSLPRSAKVWDTAATHVVLGEIGGVYTDLRGLALKYGAKNLLHEHGAVASVSMDHQKVLSCLKACL